MAKHTSDLRLHAHGSDRPGRPAAVSNAGSAFQQAFEASSLYSWLLNCEGTLLMANQSARQALPDAPDLSGACFSSTAWWDDPQRQTVENLVSRALKSYSASAEVEMQVGGRSVPVALRIRLLVGGKDQEDLLLVEARAVAEQNEKANILRKGEARFFDAFDHAAIGMAIISPEGKFVQVNRAFGNILGYASEDILTRTVAELTHPADRKADAHHLRKLLTAKSQSEHFEKRFRHAEGHDVWVLQSASVVRDAQNQPVHVLCQIQDLTQARLGKEKSLRSEAMFSAILESAPDAILLTDSLGRIHLLNARAELMFGYTRDQLIGKSVEQVLPKQPGALAVEDDPKKSSVAKAQSIGHTAVGRRSDGTEFPVEISLNPLAVRDKRLSIRIVRDVTLQQQIASELEKRARQEAAIADFGRRAVALSDVAVLMDGACEIITRTLNATFTGLLSLDDAAGALEFETLWFSDEYSHAKRASIDWWTADHLGSMAGHAIRSGQPVMVAEAESETRFDMTLTRAYGAASAAAVPIKLQDRSYGVLATYSTSPREFSTEDVHFVEAVAYLLAVAMERKHAEEALRRDRDFAERLIETAQAIVLVLDTRGRILRWNRFTEELTGYVLADVKGSEWTGALLTDDGRLEGERFFDAIVSGNQLCSTIHSIGARSGAIYEVDFSGRALTDENGAVIGVLLIGHNITELREAQRKLLETERLAAIGQMASGLAHESRNALQQIGACAEMLTIELENQPDVLDLVQGVQDAEDRLHRLFEDVRIYAVPLRLNLRKADISEAWRNAWAKTLSAHKGRNATLNDECVAARVACAVDVGTLEQAFANIFDNCFDACPDPLIVRITCNSAMLDERTAVRIDIHDNGPGLTAEQFRRVLEPFYTTKTQGTGLGMPIVRRIIQAHGGQFEPIASDKGARFAITLPCG